MGNSTIVSVIIPIYNVAPYLHQCIDSVLAQTFLDLEVILVDDGSSDGGANICDEYKKIDSRVRVLHKNNEGLVRARKDGIRLSTGEYIAYVDGDDWIEPDMIERLYSTLINENVDITMCGRYEDTGDIAKAVYHGIPEGRYDKKALKEKVYPKMIVNGAFFEWGIFPGLWDKLFRRECLEKYQNAVDDRLKMGEDAACVYPCLLNANSIYIIHECLYHYRQIATSMVKQAENKEIDRSRFQNLYYSVLKEFESYKNIYDLREQWKTYLLFLMVPRAETLHKNIDKLEYLFPFSNVKKGSKIVLYGMGTYGQLLYRFIQTSGICEVAACADSNYLELCKQGMNVVSPEDIEKYEYDYIVVASSFARARNSIYKDLICKYPKEKVQVMDEKLIKSDKSLRAFGLIQ